MNYKVLILLILMGVVISCSKDNETDPWVKVSVSMGTDSAEDVYFKFGQGEVKSVNRSGWDLAFSTPAQSAAIRINEGAGVELYSIGDTLAWDVVTTFDPSGKESLLNDKSDWSSGAFNQSVTGVFNFGWGTYNPGDHNVYGDSIYAIKLSNGEYKKLFIRRRVGTTGTYLLRWANLDGTGQVDTSFTCAPYADQVHFIHYSLAEAEVVEIEPARDAWDFLFTRYVIEIPAGPGMTMHYPVTGILSNPEISAAQVDGIPPRAADISQSSEGLNGEADVIGSDWKASDPVTHEVSLTDSLSYFVQTGDGTLYHLYFTDYGGLQNGNIFFEFSRVE